MNRVAAPTATPPGHRTPTKVGAGQPRRTRSTPSPDYDAAVEHVAGVLRAAGWEVSTLG